LFGSPDPRQIDGLGGADPLTSKVAIISAANRSDSDVTYLSGEVRLGSSDINYGIMCGNLASGVGLAAYHLKLMDKLPADNIVRIYNHNSESLIHARYDNFRDGLMGAESIVNLIFLSSGGGATAKILPTHVPLDRIVLNGREVEYSVVDAGAIYAFIRASEFGLAGNETAESLNANREMRAEVEQLRKEVCRQINRLNPHLAIHTGQIKVAVIAESVSGQSPGPSSRAADIEARIINPQGVHRAYAVSGAICCCTAAAIAGTVVEQLTSTDADNPSLTIGHPEGTLDISVELHRGPKDLSIRASSIQRSARIIMSGMVYVA
jgi:2-methylaconitate cis-trans-isomerase PrpF